MDVAHVQVHVGIFIYWAAQFSPFSFLPILGKKKKLVCSGRKHQGPSIYFPSSPPNYTRSKKVFLPIFSPKFFIHPIWLPNKHTLKQKKWIK